MILRRQIEIDRQRLETPRRELAAQRVVHLRRGKARPDREKRAGIGIRRLDREALQRRTVHPLDQGRHVDGRDRPAQGQRIDGHGIVGMVQLQRRFQAVDLDRRIGVDPGELALAVERYTPTAIILPQRARCRKLRGPGLDLAAHDIELGQVGAARQLEIGRIHREGRDRAFR